MDIKHEQLKLKHRFYIEEDGVEIGEMTYAFVGDNIIDINSTFINEDYRGRDLGLKLIEKAVSFMRANNIKAIPSCPYVEKVFNETPEYSDVKS